MQQYRAHSLIFGPWGSYERQRYDPFFLARHEGPLTQPPYLFLSCGNQDGLLPVNVEFSEELRREHLQYEFHTMPGGHDLTEWNRALPELFAQLLHRVSI